MNNSSTRTGNLRSRKDQKLHAELADRIQSLIDRGTYRVGDRLPSVRHLSNQFKVAPGTVLHMYRLLEDRGLVQARPQSGYFVRPPTQPLPEPAASSPRPRVQHPTVVDMVLRMSQMVGQDDIIQFGHATPHPAHLPTQRLNRISAAIARRTARGFNHYDLPPGCRELRIQVARHYATAGCTLSPDDFVTTCGCQEAIGLCLRAVSKPGDIIAVESPTFYGILQAIELLGLRVIEVATDPRLGVNLEALESAIVEHKPSACLFVTNAHNPLGFVMPDERKLAMVKLLARYDTPLIEDDTYGDLAFAPERPTVCKAYDVDGRVMLCSSCSKTMAPGARVGWCAPGRYLPQVLRLKFSSTLATATLPQLAIAEYFANGGYAHHLRKLRRVYADQVQQIAHAVQRHFPPGTRATRPVGGHVLWVELPAGVDSGELFDLAAARNISIAPGRLFSSSGSYRSFLRLNCAAPADARIERSLQTLGALASTLSRASTG